MVHIYFDCGIVFLIGWGLTIRSWDYSHAPRKPLKVEVGLTHTSRALLVATQNGQTLELCYKQQEEEVFQYQELVEFTENQTVV